MTFHADGDVIARVEGPVGVLRLNRPRALHALTTGMCRTLTEALLAWREDPAVRSVLITHEGDRGFCAGGDVRAAAESGKGDGALARAFFHTEYRLNHLLFAYPKTVVALMDGVTMGGGVGVSAPARVRIVTERTVWAMPEMAIGLFPDVGSGWRLPRLPGQMGTWLALTGARIGAADCLALGIATHYVASAHVPGLVERLAAGAALNPRADDPGAPRLSAVRSDIDRLFAHDTVEAILAALAAEPTAWAAEQLAILRAGSPTALKVALRLLRGNREVKTFAEEMAIEYRLAARLAVSHDFIEGVRAVLVDKDHAPRWSPAALEAVDVEPLFAPLPPAEEFTPLPSIA